MATWWATRKLARPERVVNIELYKGYIADDTGRVPWIPDHTEHGGPS